MKNEKQKTEDLKVSVIVPVYNGEKHLEQCMDSITGQTLREIEIICVDDGSADRSLEILERYAKKDERIRVICQKNAGAGAARNRGLLRAKGKYIVFWDADDKFDRKALELMYLKMQKKQTDICVCGVCEFTNDSKVYETDGYLKTALIPHKDPFNT